MAQDFRLLYPEHYDQDKSGHMKNFEFIKALQLEDMVYLPQDQFRGFNRLSLDQFYTCDPDVLRYRLEVVEDLMKHREVYDTFVKSVNIIQNIRDYWKSMTKDFTIESSLSCIRCLESYQEIIELYAGALEHVQLDSEGLNLLKKNILEIKESEEYRNLDRELGRMTVRFGHIKSITVGINLNEMLQPENAGLLEINEKPFKAGSLMNRLIRIRPKSDMEFMSTLYPLQRGLHGEELRAVNLSIQTSLCTVFERSIASFEPMIQRYYRMNTSVFVTLLDDIRFLIAGVGFMIAMEEAGFEMCKPEIADVSEKKLELVNVYNPMLARSGVEKTIVSNSISFDAQGRFYLVTGPNHGGKSIFAYSVGMAQALFQLGLFVPAHHAVMSPVTGIYTHFPSSDEDNFGKGRLESECARLSEILQEITDTDMLIMDESFSSTSGLEAGYIATEVLTGIGIIGCCGIYVTHIHDLPQRVGEINAHPDNKGKLDNLVAQMENRDEGTRSYRVVRATPDGLSYARDIASKYGLNLESILKSKQ